MNDIQALRKWRAQAVARLQDAKAKAAQAEQLGHPYHAQAWLEQHAAPAAADIDHIDAQLRAMGVEPDGKD